MTERVLSPAHDWRGQSGPDGEHSAAWHLLDGAACAEHVGTRHQEPDSQAAARPFPCTPRGRVTRACYARIVRVAPARWGVRMCAESARDMRGYRMLPDDPGRALPGDQSTQNMGTGFPAIRRQGPTIQHRGYSAYPRPPTCCCQGPGQRGQPLPSPALATPQGHAPTMALVPH